MAIVLKLRQLKDIMMVFPCTDTFSDKKEVFIFLVNFSAFTFMFNLSFVRLLFIQARPGLAFCFAKSPSWSRALTEQPLPTTYCSALKNSLPFDMHTLFEVLLQGLQHNGSNYSLCLLHPGGVNVQYSLLAFLG